MKAAAPALALSRQQGFTLAETLIAVAILGMIGMLTFGTFAGAVDGRQRAEEITTHYHQMRQALERMSREISMAFVSAHKNCEDPRSETLFVGKSDRHGMRLDFTSFSHFKIVADANESDQNELSYYIENDPGDPEKRVLLRREQARIDDEADEGGVVQVLAENVRELEFEFYDDKDDSWESDWDSTTTDYRDRLPMFVAIKLTAMNHLGEKETLFVKTRVFLYQRKPLSVFGAGGQRCAI